MEQIFLEPNEEITSVIDKLASSSGGKVAVVVPKNSTLFQSLVNLKLLAKQARELNREVVLITGNKVGQRLATQVGIETYASLGNIQQQPATLEKATPSETAPSRPETLPDGTPIRRYVPAGSATPTEQPAADVPVTPEQSSQDDHVTVETENSSPPHTASVPIRPNSSRSINATEISIEETPNPSLPVSTDRVTELPTIISRAPVQRREFHFELPWKSLAAAAALLVIAFAVTYVLLPKANVTVTLPAKAVSETADLLVRSVPSDSEDSVPGNILSVEKSLSKPIAATGKKDIGTRAGGTIAFKNCEDTQARSIAAGSKVSASGKGFTTNAAITIPAGSFSGGGTVCSSTSVNVTVTAEVAGEAHNISNGTFTIAGQTSRVSGSGTTTGGTTKQVTVLTQEDVDKGLLDLDAQASTEAIAELTAKATGQTIIEGSISLTPKTRSSDKKVGEQVDGATVTLVTTASTVVFDKLLVEAKIKDTLAKKIDEGQRLEIPEDRPITIVFKEYAADKSTMTVTAAGNGFGVPDISRGELAQAIKHSSKAKAEQQLKENFQATEVKIEISPSWWMDRLPILSSAINVEYGFSETAPAEETTAP